jgi:hypothetical protein
VGRWPQHFDDIFISIDSNGDEKYGTHGRRRSRRLRGSTKPSASTWAIRTFTSANILVLGRVLSGAGGDLLLCAARAILKPDFPKVAEIVGSRAPEERKDTGSPSKSIRLAHRIQRFVIWRYHSPRLDQMMLCGEDIPAVLQAHVAFHVRPRLLEPVRYVQLFSRRRVICLLRHTRDEVYRFASSGESVGNFAASARRLTEEAVKLPACGIERAL